MSTQLPPEGISQSAWDEATRCWQFIMDETHGIPDEIEQIARAIMAATERERRSVHPGLSEWPLEDIADCLEDMTNHYVALVSSGDCGNWSAEHEIEVQAARKMIAAIRKPQNDNYARVPVTGEIS